MTFETGKVTVYCPILYRTRKTGIFSIKFLEMKTRYLLTICFCTLLAGFSTGLRAQINGVPPWLSVNAGADTSLQCGATAGLNGSAFINNMPTGYTVSTIPYTPYSYTGGTNYSLPDDGYSAVTNLPFPFCYYGTTYNQCVIGSNGILSFRLTNAGMYCTWPINVAVPTTVPADIMNGILSPWCDIFPPVGGTIGYYTIGAAPFRAFIVYWNNVPMYSCTGQLNRYQTVLYEGSYVIDNYIGTKAACGWNGNYAIQAAHNQTGTVAAVVPGRNYPTTWTASNDGKRYTPNGAPNAVFTWWQGGVQIGAGMSINVTPSVPTTYTFQAVYTLCNGTTITVSDDVTVGSNGPGFTVSLVSQTDVDCNGGTNGSATVGTAGGTGPFTYDWNTVPPQSTITATNMPAGTYTCTITDMGSAGLCEGYVSVTILQPTTMVLATSFTPALCNGQPSGSASVIANGGVLPYSYAWTGGGTGATTSNIAAGSYTVTVTDGNSCTATATVVVTEPSAMTTIIVPTGVSCFGGNDGALTSNTNGGVFPYTFAWSTNPTQTTSLATNLSGGSYTLTVTDGNGCTLATTAIVPEPAQLVVTLAITNNTCAQISNGFIQANVTGGTGPFGYSWNTTPAQNTQTAVALNGGSYSVTVTDANGCTATASGTITPPPAIAVTVTGPTEICYGESATLVGAASGGITPYTYSWTSSPQVFTGNQSSITVSPQFGSNFFFTVTDNQGCVTTVMHPLDINILPTVSFLADVTQGCDTQMINFTNNTINGVSYLWEFGDGTTSTDINPFHFYTPGFYTVTLHAYSNEGCHDQLIRPGYITIIEDPEAHFFGTPDLFTQIVLSQATIEFTNTSSNDVAWEWFFGDGTTSTWENPIHTYTYADTFAVTLVASNQFGCTDTATHYPLFIIPDALLFIPNAFSPNGDGLNDNFDIYGNTVITYNIQIFDRWGAFMWEGNSIAESWDGMSRDNVQAPEGVYAWKITARFLDGHNYKQGGTITLIR
jgi:gliding motility-associated-like protein